MNEDEPAALTALAQRILFAKPGTLYIAPETEESAALAEVVGPRGVAVKIARRIPHLHADYVRGFDKVIVDPTAVLTPRQREQLKLLQENAEYEGRVLFADFNDGPHNGSAA